MDIEVEIQGISFEWNADKAESNLTKHDISFQEACELFFDPMLLSLEDEIVGGEVRDAIIGLTSNWKLLYVVYAFRADNIRIISARRTTKRERNNYENR